MAFNAENLTIGRGNFNNFSTQNGAAQHLYTSLDHFDDMNSPSYFPPFLGQISLNDDNASVQVGDTLLVTSTLEQFSISYVITNLNPLIVGDPGYVVNLYENIPYSGAGIGFLTFSFSRIYGRVYFDVIATAGLLTSTSGMFTLNFTIPPIYRPSPDYTSGLGAGVFLAPVPSEAGGTALNIDIVFGVGAPTNSNIVIAQMAYAPFGPGANVVLHHFSTSYIGAFV